VTDAHWHCAGAETCARMCVCVYVQRHAEVCPSIPHAGQVLKYDVGQFYNTHHDTILDQIHMMSGPRMLTAFIYFNDVEGGTFATDCPPL
jgi:hypothetical protein